MRLTPFALLLACAGSKPDDTGAPASSCWDDLAPGETTTIVEGLADGSEGIAFVGSRLFVSVPDGVLEVFPDGTTTRLATTGHALGLAPYQGGLVLADPGEFTFDGSGDDGRVLRVGLDGAVEVLADGLPNPNFVAVTPWGTVIVSDDTNETLWEVDDVGAAPWVDGIPSPNGVGFSPDGAALYVASTFVADPPLWVVPIGADHAPGAPSELAALPPGGAPDGLAVDADGRVLVAVNLAGEVVAVDPATGETEVIGAGLDTPASLAFGDGVTWDACSVYATSLYGTMVSRLAVGRPGAPLGG